MICGCFSMEHVLNDRKRLKQSQDESEFGRSFLPTPNQMYMEERNNGLKMSY